MAEARVIIFCKRVDYIVPQPEDDTLKGAWSGSRDSFFNIAAIISFELVKLGTLNFVC